MIEKITFADGTVWTQDNINQMTHNLVGTWLGVFRAAHRRVYSPADVDVIIQELGVDHPGEMMDFGTYLRPNIALVTAITPEHMEFFGSIEHVAQEELFVAKFSEYTLINRDDIDGRFADFLESANCREIGRASCRERV